MDLKRTIVIAASLGVAVGVAGAQPKTDKKAGATPAALPYCSVVDASGKEVADARVIALRDTVTVKRSGDGTPATPPPQVTCAATGNLDTGVEVKNDATCDLFKPANLEHNYVRLGSLCILKTNGTLRSIGVAPGSAPTSLTIKDGKPQLANLATDVRVLVAPDDTKAAATVLPLKDVTLGADFKGSVMWLAGAEVQVASTTRTAKVGKSGTPTDDAKAKLATARENSLALAATDCAQARTLDEGKFHVLCFYASGAEVLPIDSRSSQLVMRPNTMVLVVVSHPDGLPLDSHLEVSAEGQVGIFTPGNRNETGQPSVNSEVEGAPPLSPPPPFKEPLGPYLPGKVTVHVKVVASDKAVATIDWPTQLIVEETYSGALRLGIGGVFGGAVERNFSLRAAPGSGQQEIIAANGGEMDAELVLGAAIFLEHGGRGYAVPGHNAGFAPYFGIGILDQTDNGLKLLRSVHLGLEYELNSHFSIALTAVGRRITRLAGANVGDPVQTGGMLPTETGFAFGWAIVVNLSPDFFKLATKSGTSFFGGQ